MRRLLAVGSYTPSTGGRGKGISLIDADTAELIAVQDAPSPSYLAWSHDGSALYAAEETAQGAVSAYRLRGDVLDPLGTITLDSARPCHLALHPSRRFLVASCYGGGSFVTVPIEASGALEAPRTAIEHEGHGLHPTRQDRPHPHSVSFTADGSLAVLADIGLDTLSLQGVQDGDLEVEPRSVMNMRPGSGPRHAAWIDSATLAVVEEISATITVVRVEPDCLRIIAEGVPSTASGDPEAWPSEIAVVGGRVVVANRRPGSMAWFAWSGCGLELRAEAALTPANPRHFAADDEGVLWVALQDADLVVALDDGLKCTRSVSLGSPSCIAHRPVLSATHHRAAGGCAPRRE